MLHALASWILPQQRELLGLCAAKKPAILDNLSGNYALKSLIAEIPAMDIVRFIDCLIPVVALMTYLVDGNAANAGGAL